MIVLWSITRKAHQNIPNLFYTSPAFSRAGAIISPHFVMMAVIAKMILDKDPEFEALISRKVSHYIETFEKENVV